MPEETRPAIPDPPVPEPGEGQQLPEDSPRSGEVLPADAVLAGGGDPLVNALVVAGVAPPDKFGGHAVSLPAAAAAHFHQQLQVEKGEVQKLRTQLATVQEEFRKCCEAKAKVEGQLEAVEEPWHHDVRNVVGGGLMGAAFGLWDIHAGVAVFFFAIGLLLVAVPFLKLLGKR